METLSLAEIMLVVGVLVVVLWLIGDWMTDNDIWSQEGGDESDG